MLAEARKQGLSVTTPDTAAEASTALVEASAGQGEDAGEFDFTRWNLQRAATRFVAEHWGEWVLRTGWGRGKAAWVMQCLEAGDLDPLAEVHRRMQKRNAFPTEQQRQAMHRRLRNDLLMNRSF